MAGYNNDTNNIFFLHLSFADPRIESLRWNYESAIFLELELLDLKNSGVGNNVSWPRKRLSLATSVRRLLLTSEAPPLGQASDLVRGVAPLIRSNAAQFYKSVKMPNRAATEQSFTDIDEGVPQCLQLFKYDVQHKVDLKVS